MVMMTTIILGLFEPIWKELLAGLAGLAGLLGLYLKGRKDASTKAEIKDLRNATEIAWKASTARRDAARADAGELRRDDGFRRD